MVWLNSFLEVDVLPFTHVKTFSQQLNLCKSSERGSPKFHCISTFLYKVETLLKAVSALHYAGGMKSSAKRVQNEEEDRGLGASAVLSRNELVKIYEKTDCGCG